MKGRTPRVPPGFKEIGEEQARKILRDGAPGLMAMYVGHEPTCRYFKTNNPLSCNCNPDVEFYRIAKKKAGAR